MPEQTIIDQSPFQVAGREARLRGRTQGSLARFERAQRSLSGGVSTSLRKSARPYPLYFDHGRGAEVTDVDGNSYIDYGLAWGPLILGHCHPAINAAVEQALHRGATFGAQHDLEFQVAEKIVSMVPCADQVCFANSGTEIVQVALRLARGATGRGRFVKFEGHYHGWDDSVLVSYRSAPADLERMQPRPIATGKGQRPSPDALIARWNHRHSVEEVFSSFGGEIAAVICEPLLCNSGCIPPEPGFLEFLRDITRRNGSLLIFDEVITGFRLAPGGAQQHYGVTPDLATFAKAIGGGLPLSCLAGKHDYMSMIADGQVVHAGTLNGNPIALAAAGATLDVLTADDGAVYRTLWSRGERLRQGIEERLRSTGRPVVIAGAGPVFQVSFLEKAPREYREFTAADKALYSDLCLALLAEGILLLPDGRWYLSTAIEEEHVDRTLEAVSRVV